VYSTPATYELSAILLPDSGYLQEEEARFLNKHKLTKHEPALPLYTQAEAEASLRYFHTIPFEEWTDLGEGVSFRYRRAGHILGSAFVELRANGLTVVFSGDVGRMNDPMMRPPVPFEHADYLVVESTYGNRRHPDVDPAIELAEVVRRTVDRGGTVVIPAFAVGRAQLLLHLLSDLSKSGEIPKVPIYLNSPMAINATNIYCQHAGEHRLGEAQCGEMFAIAEMVKSPEASRALNTNMGPTVIISASGMATGGRVVHHLKTLLPDPRNTVLFAGFQAPGTRGEALVSGAEEVKIHGQYVPVRAEVVDLDNMSAHGDYLEILEWLGHCGNRPRRVFITHGEPAAADAMRQHLRDNLRWPGHVAAHQETVRLTA
jgi:metallo-beta-lactamase family protein